MNIEKYCKATCCAPSACALYSSAENASTCGIERAEKLRASRMGRALSAVAASPAWTGKHPRAHAREQTIRPRDRRCESPVKHRAVIVRGQVGPRRAERVGDRPHIGCERAVVVCIRSHSVGRGAGRVASLVQATA